MAGQGTGPPERPGKICRASTAGEAATAIFRTYDQAALDAQYDNRARVPDHPRHLKRYAEESEAARRALESHLDIAYGPHPRERLDLFPAQRGAPLHLFIHGGYWRALDKASFSYLAPAFVESGIAFAAISYKLAPADGMGEIVASVRRAVSWLHAHAADYGCDPARLTASGHSAGGHLVAMAAAEPGAPLRAGLALSGLYDLEPIRLCYLNADVRLDAASAKANAPMNAVRADMPKLILAVGAAESEEYHRQQADYAAALRKAGNAVEAHTLAGHDHFTIVGALGEKDSALFGIARRMVEMA